MTVRTHGYSLLELIVAILVIGALLAILVPIIARGRESSKRAQCAHNLFSLYLAMTYYSDAPTYAGQLPTLGPPGDPFNADAMRSLNLLYPDYVQDYRVFSCPSHPTLIGVFSLTPTVKGNLPKSGAFLSAQNCGYGYDPGHDMNSSPLIPLLADRSLPGANSANNLGSGQNVLLSAGSVEWLSGVQSATDPDIYQLNPEIPRKQDSWIRQ